METEELIKEILNAIYAVRGNLSAGYLESVYKKALMIELRLRGIKADAEVPIRVDYKGYTVGEFRADIIVENAVIIEIKAVELLNPIHEVQLVNYLTSTGIDNGILVNFGAGGETRRKYRVYKPKR